MKANVYVRNNQLKINIIYFKINFLGVPFLRQVGLFYLLLALRQAKGCHCNP